MGDIKKPIDLCVIQDNESAESYLGCERKPAVSSVVIIDQTVPPNSVKVATMHKLLMEKAADDEIPLYYGRGMSLQLLCNGILSPGEIVASCDPLIRAVGAVGAIGIFITPEQMAEILNGKEIEYNLPEEETLVLKCGSLKNLKAYDIALSIIKSIGAENCDGHLFKITGEAAKLLSTEEKITVCALLAKAGAMSRFDDSLSDAVKAKCIEYTEDLVAMPGGLTEIRSVCELPETAVKSIFIGGTAGGCKKDIMKVASMLKGRKIAYGTRMIIAPATADIYIECADAGYLTDLMEAGALVINQCGNAEVQGRIGKDEVMVSNDVENALGYAGYESSRTFLTDTVIAVRSALSGYLGNSEEKEEDENPEQESMSFEGRCWKFGDDIDTDIIIPTQHLNYETMDEIKSHAFEPLRPELAALLREGDIIVAGSNFGCGSSREQAAEVLAANGIHCVLAKSFARIFFRNAINNGILLLECQELSDNVSEGDIVRVNLDSQSVSANGKDFKIPAVPENLWRIIADGGLVKNIMKKVKNEKL